METMKTKWLSGTCEKDQADSRKHGFYYIYDMGGKGGGKITEC